jgi:hypothetical protein
MDQIGEIVLRLKISELEAQLVLREIGHVGPNRQIGILLLIWTKGNSQSCAANASSSKWGEIMVELQDVRERYAQELVSRSERN